MQTTTTRQTRLRFALLMAVATCGACQSPSTLSGEPLDAADSGAYDRSRKGTDGGTDGGTDNGDVAATRQPDAGVTGLDAGIRTGTGTLEGGAGDDEVPPEKNPAAFVACNGATGDEVPAFTDDGRLTQVDMIVGGQDFEWNETQQGSMRMSPDGRHMYLFSHADYVLAILSRNPVDGTLTHVESFHKDSEIGGHIQSPGAGVFIDEGLRLVIPDFLNGTLEVFRRDPDSGSLRYERQVRVPSTGRRWPMDPVYVASADRVYGSLVTRGGGLFWLDVDAGLPDAANVVLGESLGIAEFEPDQRFAVSRDGRDYYAATTNPAVTIQHLRIDAEAGTARHISTLADGVGGTMMSGWPDIVTAPDDSHLYTTSVNSKHFGHYLRDCETGRLKLVGHYGQAGSPCGNHEHPVVSGDGLNLYVGAHTPTIGTVVAAYSRDPHGGGLRLLELLPVETRDDSGISPEIVISPDQRHLYAARGWRGVHIFTFARATAPAEPEPQEE